MCSKFNEWKMCVNLINVHLQNYMNSQKCDFKKGLNFFSIIWCPMHLCYVVSILAVFLSVWLTPTWICVQHFCIISDAFGGQQKLFIGTTCSTAKKVLATVCQFLRLHTVWKPNFFWIQFDSNPSKWSKIDNHVKKISLQTFENVEKRINQRKIGQIMTVWSEA